MSTTTESTTDLYAPDTPVEVLRTAALIGACHFGTEAVTVRKIAGDPTAAIVYRVDGRHPGGWDILGPSVIVGADGSRTVDD